MARAELDGLGRTNGPVVTWTVPQDLAQGESPAARVFGFTPQPAPSATGAPGWTSWLGLGCLMLLVGLLSSRIKSKSPPR